MAAGAEDGSLGSDSFGDRASHASGAPDAAAARVDRLEAALRDAREQIVALRERVDRLTTPPTTYGTIVADNGDGSVDVAVNGRKIRVVLGTEFGQSDARVGAQVSLNESSAIVGVRPVDRAGEVVSLVDVLADGIRAVVDTGNDSQRVCELSADLRGSALRPGDALRMDPRSGLLLERLERRESEQLLLEVVPDVTYADIGGLDGQIERIADAVELPFLHAELFAEYRLPAPKGILLYGPPGCGKTLIAKAVANSLARKVGEKSGQDKARSYFINVRGPELLNKYVGETERQIRLIFQRAREKSEEGWPVIVFFDEMDSMFRTRGSGISSDMESTVVPQLLAELDGVESLRNVIVIGATNREDLIDPAILRPGRLDVKIRVDRPDEQAARQIFARYLHEDLPVDADLEHRTGTPASALGRLTEVGVSAMYSRTDDTAFLEVTYEKGEKEVLHFRDFVSGAMIENVVRRAKQRAIKRAISGGRPGVCEQDIVEASRQEFAEHEDLPNTTNPEDWAKISGRKGERIVYIRTLRRRGSDATGGRSIDRSGSGQYL
ncbi:MAG: proteasome ATPase [Acidobacteria bacterium]|nr:proteasome ATPase [Acidobacteriota bacterium]